MAVPGVVKAEVSFEEATATLTVAKDLDPALLIAALQDPYSCSVREPK